MSLSNEAVLKNLQTSPFHTLAAMSARIGGLFLLLAMVSCGNGASLKGFDAKAWEADKFGCKGQRLALQDTLFAQRAQLMGMPESQLIAMLGKPDKVNITQRNVRFYTYSTANDSTCGKVDGTRQWIKIRIDAIDRVAEMQRVY